ncbi:hypothetical protein CAPTEDRAFT_204484 [Capitella teleta]|uniref:Apple domain-containing protein n=1 Tax=Capitella teleta TaxID=283909 RepID=R7TDJ4_CAPTE|nr:hypothetical protein CAPTEDRAFT_204484 [Capitella teleta]|eukprot:ELT91582.1 hypothetical protein CAPTEDRAFT_204484 [Capitella teleta]
MNYMAVYVDGTQVRVRCGNGIRRSDYVGNGYALHVLNLSSDLSDRITLSYAKKAQQGWKFTSPRRFRIPSTWLSTVCSSCVNMKFIFALGVLAACANHGYSSTNCTMGSVQNKKAIDMNNLMTIKGISLAACQQRCLDESCCKSIDYCRLRQNTCYLNSIDSNDASVVWKTFKVCNFCDKECTEESSSLFSEMPLPSRVEGLVLCCYHVVSRTFGYSHISRCLTFFSPLI